MRPQFRYMLVKIGLAYLIANPGFTIRSFAAEHDQSSPLPETETECHAIGTALAERNGGIVAKVSQSQRGSQSFCVLIIIEAGPEGARPRRDEFLVPID